MMELRTLQSSLSACGLTVLEQNMRDRQERHGKQNAVLT